MRCKWLVLLLCLLLPCAAAAEERFSFGASEQGRALECVRLGEADAESSLLMTFAVHGFEDGYAHDGRVLVEIADRLIDHYGQNPDSLMGCALYIVPCVNPDGLIDGTSKDGFGRANANGIDINRDFPAEWKPYRNTRNRTGDAPFASAEARAVRNLVEQVQPTWAVDVHGWINRVYGHEELAQVFMDSFGFGYSQYQSGGKLSQWLAQCTEAAVLVELPFSPSRAGYAESCAQKLTAALDAWFAR